MSGSWCAFLAFHLAAVRLFAQPPAAPDTPVFKSAANLVEAAAVVRDGQGKAVGSLTVEDFQLFDNGARQAISRFGVVQLQRRPPAAPNRSTPPNHFVAFVVDDQNLGPETFPPAPLATIQHLSRLHPGDRTAVAATSGRLVLDFTDDREKLRDALSRMGSLDRRETFDISKLNGEITCRITYLKADRILAGDSASLRNCVPAPGQQPIRSVRPPTPGLPVPGQSGEGHRIFLENQVRATPSRSCRPEIATCGTTSPPCPG